MYNNISKSHIHLHIYIYTKKSTTYKYIGNQMKTNGESFPARGLRFLTRMACDWTLPHFEAYKCQI